jgi:hypothetical protein
VSGFDELDPVVIEQMTGPGMYRIVELSFGYQPEQYYQTKDEPLWLPLLPNGYWADPDAYSTGKIAKNSIMTRAEAERAVWLAKKINHGRGEGASS